MNAVGDLPLSESSHFLQANALLNLQLVHSKADKDVEPVDIENTRPRLLENQATGVDNSRQTGFTSEDLIFVMRELRKSQPVPWEVSYFDLSHKLGTAVVDSLVRGRLLQLRWTSAITPEGRNPVRRPFVGREWLARKSWPKLTLDVAVVLPSTPGMLF